MRIVTVVTRNSVREQHVIFRAACSNVVNDQGPVCAGMFPVRDDADMGAISGQQPRDKVSRMVVGCSLAEGELGVFAVKERLQVRHASMIDVGVRRRQPPRFWVLGEMILHVFMHQLLKVNVDRAIRSNDDIGAYAAIRWNIPLGVGDGKIAGVVALASVHARSGRNNEPLTRIQYRGRQFFWQGDVLGLRGANCPIFSGFFCRVVTTCQQ